jgi:DNA-binding protein YbaB
LVTLLVDRCQPGGLVELAFGPQDLIDQLRTFAAQGEEFAHGIRTIEQQAAAISITERSADGAVTVTVNKDGAVTDIAFTNVAQRMSPATLSATVMDCVRRATGRIGERYSQIVGASGLNKDSADRITAHYREKNPDRFLAEPPSPIATKPRPRPTDDDENFTIMQRGYQR